MALNDVALASRALIRLGAAPIASFNDGSAEAEIAGALFAPVRDSLLSAYGWSFASGQITLGLHYRIARQALHAHASDVLLTYIFRPEEEEFPPYFDAALIARLSAEFCIPVTENTARAEVLFRMATIEYERARQIDAQQDSPGRIEDFSLIKARQ
ncbi:MAG: hypothetical protein NDJ24_01970 [Alphaproteobacteria bacterium]|nr:hypothetical protein [Alphaproteobacteria bacterium]